MADAPNVASYRKLSWSAGWQLREASYRQARAMIITASDVTDWRTPPSEPDLAALCFGSLDPLPEEVSNDGPAQLG